MTESNKELQQRLSAKICEATAEYLVKTAVKLKAGAPVNLESAVNVLEVTKDSIKLMMSSGE